MDYLLYYIGQKSNYKVMNEVNIFNCFICILEKADTEEDKKAIINLIKLNIGITFYENLRLYLFRKDPNSELLKLMS